MGAVTRRFPKRTFVPLGSVPAETLGLSARRSDELRLHRAWRRSAGPRLAAMADPLAIRRGVLELQMTIADEAWCRTLLEMAPQLAASVAATHRGTAFHSVRLLSVDGDPIGEIQPLATDEPRAAARQTRPAADKNRPPRLDRLMQAYLSRSEPPASEG